MQNAIGISGIAIKEESEQSESDQLPRIGYEYLALLSPEFTEYSTAPLSESDKAQMLAVLDEI